MMSNPLPHEVTSRLILEWIDNVQETVLKMFDPQKIAPEVLKLSKDYSRATMNMISASQDYYEKVWNTILESYGVAQGDPEGKKMFQDWLTRTKQARESFTQTMEKNWEKIEAGLATTPKPGK